MSVWKFNDVIAIPPFENIEVDFKSYDTEFDSMNVLSYDDINILRFAVDYGQDCEAYNFAECRWENEAYKTIELITEPTDEAFIAWIKANARRQFGTTAERLAYIAEHEQTVYDTGKETGRLEGVASGKQEEYDAFWNALQENGDRWDYNYGFAGTGWNATTFRPKYSILGLRFYFAFAGTSNLNLDLREIFPGGDSGLTLDTSESINTQYMFQNSTVTALPALDLSSLTTTPNAMFSGCKTLETIELITFPESITNYATSVFQNCNALTNIEAAGTIAGSISLTWSPLSVESMKSIISCLKNYLGTTNEGSYTVKFSDECWTNLEADAEGAPEGYDSWEDYIIFGLGWSK